MLGSPIFSVRALIMSCLHLGGPRASRPSRSNRLVLVSPRLPQRLASVAIEPRVLRPASPGLSRVVGSLAIVICSYQGFGVWAAFAGRPRARSSEGPWRQQQPILKTETPGDLSVTRASCCATLSGYSAAAAYSSVFAVLNSGKTWPSLAL